MSGHSKWSTIKRQKGAADIKRGQIFTKLSNAITFAVKQGSGITDPEKNVKLRLAIETARTANMPKENVQRAIQRAVEKQAGDMEELLYEGFGPGGFSVIVEAVTDNSKRTVSEVKNVFDKNGGNLGIPGSVGYQFQQKGLIKIAKNGKSIEDLFLIAADSGAEDLEEVNNEIFIYTESSKLTEIQVKLNTHNIQIASTELIRKPTRLIELSTHEDTQRAANFIQKLEELEDVQKVYVNITIPEKAINN